ncbi:SCO family protein [Pseudomonas sp. UL073]|uniref:SCO family protein n=1 Tax=Zestomonas insulae TaxID=2809017 RepID=A0ABS2IGV4_9GAMM|nr:SCO family protein [Pseudomonas insulae]MBM7062290.1 SCO family protein [Pseudomonas insulae]
MNTRRNIIAGLGTAALGLLAWRAGQDPVASDRAQDDGDAYLPNTKLYTHEGKAVRFYDDLVRDKIVAINMMYTSCGKRCPTMTANMRAVQQLLGERAGRDVFLYSITLEPLLDSPAVLKEYAEKYRIGRGWSFLTGDPDDMERLRYRLGFYDVNPEVDANKTNHTGMVRIGNDRFNRWTMAPALAEPKQILAVLNHIDPDMVMTV